MKPQCADLLNQAAGRKLSKDELDGIESRITGSLRQLAAEDPKTFSAMSQQDRYTEAAKRAKEQMLKDTVWAHESAVVEAGRKADLMNYTASVKPGFKGQVHALYQLVADPFKGVQAKTDAIAANFFRQLDGPAAGDGGKFFGLFQNTEFQKDLTRAFYGEQAGPEAVEAAKGLKGMLDNVVQRFQRAGLKLNAREDYRTPQPQDPTLVAQTGANGKWVDDHMNWVDRRQYTNADGSSMTDDQLRSMLEESYQSISTDGANKLAEGGGQVGSSLVGQNKNAPRRLFYKDAASYSAAMEKYGRSTNLFDLIQSHVRGMSRDIAMAETFGRNAEKNYKQVLAGAFKNDQNALAGEKVPQLQSFYRKTERIFDAVAHPLRPQNAEWANYGAQVRGLLGATQLGSLVGALPDLSSAKMAAELSGLPAMNVFRDFAKTVAAGPDGKAFLHKLGIWQEGFQHAAIRMGVEDIKQGWGTWLNELTHKAMGLNAFDRGLRAGNGLVVMDTLGKFSREAKTLAETEGDHPILSRAGVTEDHWQTWQKAQLDGGPSGDRTLLTPESIYNIPDAELQDRAAQRIAGRSEVFQKAFKRYNDALARDPDNASAQEQVNAFHDRYGQLMADEIQRMKDEAAEKLLQTAYGQMQFGARGASHASAADQVALGLDKLPAGTPAGELWRFLTQFKGVPLGVFRAHWEGMKSLDSWGSRASYGARFVAYNALAGALAVELKALMNGQDPRSLNPNSSEGRKVLAESVATGGGMGLYGDLFLNGQTKMGSGVEVLGGPGISAGYDLIKEIGQAREALANGDTKHDFTLAGVRWVRKNAVPLGNLWYTKAAFNRIVYDQLQDYLAPGSSDKQRQRMESRGVKYWWAPGTTSPQRSPDLSTVGE